MQYIHLDSVGSTNDFVRDLLSEYETGSGIVVVSTDEQTSGRGQRGNSWESEAKSNLTFSVLCHPVWVDASKQFILSQAMALAILDSLNAIDSEQVINEKERDVRFSVKWPNDIYYGDRKICGTLIECDLSGKRISNCIIGSGVNVNQKEFRSDAPNPISLYQIYDREFDLEWLLRDVCDRFEEYFDMIRDGMSEEVRKKYLDNLYRSDGYYRYKDKDGEFTAKIKGIEESGRLMLERVDGEARVYEFKELIFKLGIRN